MASRFLARTATSRISSLKSAFKTSSASPRFPLPTRSATSSPLRRFSISRTPSELGCVQSLLPLHSAVATARMTSCLSSSTSCRALSQVLGLSGPR
uniref:Protein NUCLEAR FUSION DEFECTIVE 6, chloroplastic/mitochondrial-like n=1 Tax=Kalanchoe fedtschenkoi TaxID=63787 RepID=A0A7N0SZJ6_KALFE